MAALGVNFLPREERRELRNAPKRRVLLVGLGATILLGFVMVVGNEMILVRNLRHESDAIIGGGLKLMVQEEQHRAFLEGVEQGIRSSHDQVVTLLAGLGRRAGRTGRLRSLEICCDWGHSQYLVAGTVARPEELPALLLNTEVAGSLEGTEARIIFLRKGNDGYRYVYGGRVP